jgi:hypothetical protein
MTSHIPVARYDAELVRRADHGAHWIMIEPNDADGPAVITRCVEGRLPG